MRSYMAWTERRAVGGRVAFSWSIRRIEAMCGPSLGYLRLLGPYGCGCGWASILRMVFGLMPVSRAICFWGIPATRTRCRIAERDARQRAEALVSVAALEIERLKLLLARMRR